MQGRGCFLGARPQRGGHLAQQAVALAQQLRRRRPGHRLYAPHVGRARGLAEDVKDPDLRRGAHVRPPAQLARMLARAHLDHAHDLAVLLAEEGHRAKALRLIERRDHGPHGVVARDPLVDLVLDVTQLLRRERGAVAEVEAQLVWADV